MPVLGIYAEKNITERVVCTSVFTAALFTIARTWKQRRQWHPTPALLPGKSHGQRSLVGCRLWGRTESDTTEAT